MDVLRNARVGCGWICVDGIRLSRRADSLWMAVDQFAVRHRGYVRISEGHVLLLQGVVGQGACRCIVFPHWNFEGREGDEISVWVYSNLDEVELLVNGKSQGKQKVPHLGHVQWKVQYEPGAIEARGFKGGKVVLTEKRETTGAPVSIRMTADRTEINADGEDIAAAEGGGSRQGRTGCTDGEQFAALQCVRCGQVDWRGQRRSELPGKRQGSDAISCSTGWRR